MSNLAAAFEAYCINNYLAIHEMKDYELKHEQNPEQLLIKKEAYINLTGEAKAVIELIANAPKELIEQNSWNKISKRKLYSYLRKRKNWTNKTIVNTFNELKYFVCNF